jgi:Caspase domain/WD domain, G-beta repeat
VAFACSMSVALRRLRHAILVIALSALFVPPAAAERRAALIIGNAEYVHSKRLSNPTNDASLIADKLRTLGFFVRLEKNVDARQFAEIVQDFAASLDRGTDALFYYAGHGMQFRGENLFVGVDAYLKSEAGLQFETFRLNSIINLLEDRASTVLFFWDACRDNPLAEALVRSVGASGGRSSSELTRSGAAPLPPRKSDTLIVFSAEPGKLALDGKGDYSPFAEALSQHIMTANVEIESMLKCVTADVMKATQQFQRPERLSQLTRDFYFRRQGSEAVEAASDDEELRKLRKRLAELELEPTLPRRRFRIINADDPAFRDAIRVTTRSGAPNEQSQEKPASPARPAPRDTPNSPAKNVVIAVKQSAATIVRRLRVSPDAKLLATGDEDGFVRIIRLETFEVVSTIRAHTGRVSDLDFSPDSRTLLTAGRDGLVRFWDVQGGKQLRELSEPNTIPYSAKMNSNNPDRWVLMGDRSGRLIGWDLKQNRVITNGIFHHGPIASVGYQPNGGGTYMTGGGDGQLKIRLPMGQRNTIQAHDGAIFQASYSASGRLLYTVGSDRKAKLWNTAKLNGPPPQATLEGHLRYVLAADMSADEKVLATGGGDKAINLWDVNVAKLTGRLEGHTSDVEAVAFSPNGKFLVSTSEDKSVRIWSIENREELVRLFFRKDDAKYAGVTQDNQTFGHPDSGLFSIYVDGREVLGEEADRAASYIGNRIAIID